MPLARLTHSPRSPLYRALPALALGLAAYFQASAVNSLFAAALVPDDAPPFERRSRLAAEPEERPTGDAILARNPFDSRTGPLGRHAPPPPQPEAPPPGVDDPLRAPRCTGVRVVLTSVSDNPLESRAVLKADGEPQGATRRVGDRVQSYQVAFIGRNPLEWSPAVWLMNGDGLCQSLLFDPPSEPKKPKAEKPKPKKQKKSRGSSKKTPDLPPEIARGIDQIGPGRYRVERSAVEAILEKGAELMRAVRMRPTQADGKVVAMQIRRVRPGTLLDVLGLKSGDQIQSINGFKLTGPAQALQAYARLRVADNIRVTAVRGGTPLELEYRIQ